MRIILLVAFFCVLSISQSCKGRSSIESKALAQDSNSTFLGNADDLINLIQTVKPLLSNEMNGTEPDTIVAIRIAEPHFGRDYASQYKVTIAKGDGTGAEYSNARCIVVQKRSHEDSVITNIKCETVKDIDPVVYSTGRQTP